MALKNGFSTFMNTAKESRLWHKGIYKGLKAGFKTHDPSKIYDRLKLSDSKYSDWYGNDGHYYDVPFVAMYLLSTAVELGVVYAVGKFLGV